MAIGKRKAQEIAREERLTWGDLKNMMDQTPFAARMSIVNPTVYLSNAAEIYLAAIASRDAEAVPKAWRDDPYSYNGAMKPSRDFLIVTNILRDFHR